MPDMYNRRPISTSRGKTDARIMALQHDPASIPGAEALDGDLPEGSIGAMLRRFHTEWVALQPVTSRRSYERALALLVRDLDEHTSFDAPAPARAPHNALASLDARTTPDARDSPSTLDAPIAMLDLGLFTRHFVWRREHNVGATRELARTCVQFARLSAWAAEHASGPEPVTREQLIQALTAAV